MKNLNKLYFIFFIALAGCSTAGPTGYKNIQPTYEVHNSPIPVPWPREKPAQGTQEQSAPNVTSASSDASFSTSSSSSASSSSSVSTNTNSRTVTVQKGDTLYSISRILNIELKALIEANNLSPPYALNVGKVLNVPESRYHVVKRGETGYSISRKYGVDLTRLVRVNGLNKPYHLKVGQKLQVPSSSKIEITTATNNPTAARMASAPPSRKTVARLPKRESSKFLWPVDGKIISAYGAKEGGLHNDGINIVARQGAAVKAADAGVVAYAGGDIKGFGQLLLIRHDGGWVTAYAHNDILKVRRGEAVRRGQTIAEVGTSGAVSKPQLHFEVRRGTRAVNPVPYLAH